MKDRKEAWYDVSPSVPNCKQCSHSALAQIRDHREEGRNRFCLRYSIKIRGGDSALKCSQYKPAKDE